MAADSVPLGEFHGGQKCPSTEPPRFGEIVSKPVVDRRSIHRAARLSDGQDTLYLQPTATASAACLVPTCQSAPSDSSRRKFPSSKPFKDAFDTPLGPHAKQPPAARERPTILAGFHTPTDVTSARNAGSFLTSESMTAAVQRAAASVVMVLIDDGAWGSGVVLSTSGLILTNAHLIEPWRFAAKPKVQASKPQPLARTSAPLVQTFQASLSDGRIGVDKDFGHLETRGFGDVTGSFEGVPGARTGHLVNLSAEPVNGSGNLWEETDSECCSGWQGADSRSKVGYWEWINGAGAMCKDQDGARGQLKTQQAAGTESPSAVAGECAPVEDQSSPFPPPGLRYETAQFTEPLAKESDSSESAGHKRRAHRALILHQTASNPPRRYRPVRVRLGDREGATWQSARVVFVSQGPFDAALLQLLDAPTDLQPIVPAPYDASLGDTALVIGHGLFGPMTDLRPSVYSGVVSRVVKSRGRPAMLQTTAAVHPGGSGGAVVDSRGRLIGLVTSAARHSGGSMLPHLNFSIPAKALQPLVDFAGSGGLTLGLLDPLNTADSHLSAIWALAPPPPMPRPPSPLPGLGPDTLPDQEDASPGSVKGTKFAQFLADRGQGLMKMALLRSKL